MRSSSKRASRSVAPTLSLLVAAVLAACSATAAGRSKIAGPVPAPTVDAVSAANTGTETAILSGGCFWGVQGVFEHVRGVQKVVAGYAGGGNDTANYETVSTGLTRHAESVEITFDPRQISYGEILRIFFSVATDPTQVDQQYPDQGPQYRSEIFFTTADQQRVAHSYIHQLDSAGVFGRAIATRVDPATGFYPAEGYHQDFLVRHPDHPYIVAWDLPKVAALAREFPTQYRAQPVMVGGG